MWKRSYVKKNFALRTLREMSRRSSHNVIRFYNRRLRTLGVSGYLRCQRLAKTGGPGGPWTRGKPGKPKMQKKTEENTQTKTESSRTKLQKYAVLQCGGEAVWGRLQRTHWNACSGVGVDELAAAYGCSESSVVGHTRIQEPRGPPLHRILAPRPRSPHQGQTGRKSGQGWAAESGS